MSDAKITLDRETFKALSSDTRIEILKLLGVRRMTLSEMAKRLGMSVSTVKEHLDGMCCADLIVQMDEGNKWKYYELTRKGRDIVNPVPKNVFIVLGLSVLAVIASFRTLITSLAPSEPMLGIAGIVEEKAYDSATNDALPMMTRDIAPTAQQAAASLPYAEIALFALFVLILGACIGYLVARKRRIGISV